MIKKWPVTIPQLTGKRYLRNVYVYVPDEAQAQPDARYPVLYLFDGHNVFFDQDATYGKSWGMSEYVKRTQLPMMIVGVECSHKPPNGRLSEYSPFTFENRELGRIKGRGHITMDWMTGVLKPYIDQYFPTLPQRKYTFIGGSSMGGLMSLYGVMAYNHVFSRAAALSPSVWFAPRKLNQMLRSSPIQPDTVVYMDYGSQEMPSHPAMRRQFTRVASTLLERGVLLDCRIVPDGSHCEASWERQIPFFMNTLLYGVNR